MAQRVAAACQSAGRDNNVTAMSRGVDSNSDDVSATQSVIDLTDDNLFFSWLQMIDERQARNGWWKFDWPYVRWRGHFPGKEMVNEDSVNHISDGGVDLFGQETVNWDAESNDAPQDGGVRLGKKQDPQGDEYALNAE